MIDFEPPKPIKRRSEMVKMVAEQVMRPISRYYDEHEHEHPWDYSKSMWEMVKSMGMGLTPKPEDGEKASGVKNPERPPIGYQMMVHVIEGLSWGDAGLYLATPSSALAGAAIMAVGTQEQKDRFLTRFQEGEPKWGAMAMTESQAGSDTAAIRTHAELSADGKEWILNGEKIFVTGGLMAAQDAYPSRAGVGILVVWATIDPQAGRAGMRPFVVEGGTRGMAVTKTEDKHGIRASDTAAIVFTDCRIPYENILGSPEVGKGSGRAGFKGAMKTFDATRPAVAAGAIGIGRACVDFVEAYLAERGVQIRYGGVPYQEMTAVERDVIEMRAQLKAAWLLTIRSAWLMDNDEANTLEASMAKVKAGQAVTWISQKAVEILGPEGYSTSNLVEKWMRDARINDIYEGTGQINRLIVARQILGYRSEELR